VFREEDAPFFFGRDSFTRQLCDAVARKSVVAVVGRSGSGKSSVVRAGLVPLLRRHDADRVWEIVTLVPGDRLLRALSSALLPLLEPEMSETNRLVEIKQTAKHLAAGDLDLRDLAQRIIDKQQGTDRLLLLVDQWEELYTHAAGEDDEHKVQVDRFIDELLDAADHAPLTLVLTLRADFYGEVLQHRGLADRFRNAVVNLGPMTRIELTEAISAPAEKVGLRFDTGLVDHLLDDVGDEPGNLPLLEFALKQLWEQRQGHQLLYQRYKAMGRIKGAIAQRAETLYAGLEPSQQRAAEQVFTRLVRPGDETGDTRRRAELVEFKTADQKALIRLFAGPDVRLLVTGSANDVDFVEVAHEALIREWGQVRPWVDKVRRQRRDQTLMDDLARDWDKRDRPAGKLAMGPQLRDFRRAGAASGIAEEYLATSLKQRRWRWLASGTAGLLLVAGLASFFWWSAGLGLNPGKGMQLVLFRAEVHHPPWIPEMRDIPPGEFLMGSADSDEGGEYNERPQHMVGFDQGFRLGRYEVTFAQYCTSTTRACPDPLGWARDDRPVINVSWHDARDYADWLSTVTGQSYRLPSEAEWEYAARAGTTTSYWWGESIDEGGEVWANCDGCGSQWDDKETAPVGEFSANAFGLHDTAGNVWEWVRDCLHDSDSYAGAPTDGVAWLEADGGDCDWRVLRGGSWYGTPGFVRSAFRHGSYAVSQDDFIGFRLARDP